MINHEKSSGEELSMGRESAHGKERRKEGGQK